MIRNRTLQGIVFMVLAMSIVPWMDAVAKYLSAEYSNIQIVWARFFFHFLWIGPFVIWHYRERFWNVDQPILHLLRGGCLLLATLFFFGAIRVIGIADAIALVFIWPIVVTLLSIPVLGEAVGIRRGIAVVIGFIGLLVILRPGMGVMAMPHALYAVLAGLSYAVYALLTRRLSGETPPLIMLTYTAVLGAVVMSFLAPFDWKTPDMQGWSWFVLLGFIAAIGHFCVISAFQRADAAIIAPLGYLEIIAATTIGYVIFGDFPDGPTWIGIAIIVACGSYIFIRESKLARAEDNTSRTHTSS